MENSYEKKWANETSSTAVLINAPVYQGQASTPIRHHFVFSLFSVLCLCPATGLIALAYSIKSSAKADVSFHEKARLYSRRALLWNLASVVFAVLSLIVTLIFCYQLNETMKAYGNEMNKSQFKNDINRLIQSIAENN